MLEIVWFDAIDNWPILRLLWTLTTNQIGMHQCADLPPVDSFEIGIFREGVRYIVQNRLPELIN